MPHTGQQYALLNNVSSRTLELFMLVNSFRRAAELKVLVLVLWHVAPKESPDRVPQGPS